MSAPVLVEARVLGNQEVAPDCRRLVVHAPQVAGAARPGQFVMVRCGSSWDPLLRRPFSVAGVDREAGAVTLLFRVVGRGTALMAGAAPGETLSLLGPLGRGFTLPQAPEATALIGGGMGLAPLLFLADELLAAGCRVWVLAGAGSRTHLFVPGPAPGCEVLVATEDGSAGTPGPVTVLLPLVGRVRRYYACGPREMLRAVAAEMERRGVPGEVCLEERMACGVGACRGCVCRVRRGEGMAWATVCAEGPVFPAGEVCWE
ncbi:MAG: dihydroorotate dehydrogenase electron transfer subunit [Firmicutes bacterium]|nr:dihydroorotate dehydrogenase electron transfer subunit [Bacillota bacterium]